MNKMKRKGILKRLAVCAVSMTMLASATACGKPDDVGGKIAVIAKNDKVSFWDEVKTGATDCCDEMGYELEYYAASSDNDFASQIEFINDAIDKGVKAIVIAPNDPDELNEAFEKAEKKGIKIVNINSRSNYDGIVSYVGSSDFDGGAVAARNAASLYIPSEFDANYSLGKIAMIGHTAATAELRLTGFRATLSPLVGAYIGKQQAAKAQAAAADAQQAAAEAQAAQEQAAAGADKGMTVAAASAASQASQNGAPAEAVLNAAKEAAAGAAPAGTSEATIMAVAQAAVDALNGESSDGESQGGAPASTGEPSEEEKAAMLAKYFIEGERCGTQEAAYEEAKKLLTENPDISVIYGTNTNTTLGICQAIDELDLASTVTVVGFNSDEQELQYIKTGILDGTIIQNPYNMGYIGVRYAIQSAGGSGVTGNLDTGVTWISAKNINDDAIQLLLYPEKA